ncbi:S-adenosyl-L-methionine-dependent methyltransferase [Stipitochalara longipes BDJ]|nr:S-adenosyl-L-methionine-dependent methyltransferase [Stipitochalara longipes BDJ]
MADNLPIEASDNDSAIVDEDIISSTSISSSILKYREENGRTYHAYKDGRKYARSFQQKNLLILPDLQHHMMAMTLGGKLYLAPIPKEQKLDRVADLGTGTGIWAIDFADEHPESQVLGVDLSPIQPSFLPPNCAFEVDDIEEPWTYKFKSDFLHLGFMLGSLSDWPKCFRQCFEGLNPGGWIEIQDFNPLIQDNDNSFPPNCAVRKWTEFSIEAANKLGRPLDSPTWYKAQMEAAGFQNVVETKFKWPQNRWPKDPKMRELGKTVGMWMYENFSGGVQGLSMALFTRGLGWSAQEVEAFLVDVRKDMKDTKIHGYYNISVVYGQKPE